MKGTACVRLPRAFSIISFRVSLLSAGIFAVVAILLFVAMDWAITDYMEELVDQSIETQLSDLRDNGLLPAAPRQDFDVERLGHWLNQRQALAPSHLFHYMLRDPDGKAVTGSVEGARLVPGWQNIPLPNFHDPYDGDEHSLRGWGERLPNGYLLFIGRDIHEIDELLDRIEIAFGAVLLTILVLSLVSSFFVSQWFLIRLDRINATCRAIMAGDLSQRIEQEPGEDDFSRLSSNLNSMLDRIHGLMEGMQQISNDIAHDMRPLDPVASFLGKGWAARGFLGGMPTSSAQGRGGSRKGAGHLFSVAAHCPDFFVPSAQRVSVS